jgi:uncharacterized membrane protein HdeD (DUF308 family)
VKTFPSYVFAALGVALLVLGIAAIAYGTDAGERIIGALVAIIGVVQIIFGGFQRKTEDIAPPATDTAPQTP